MKLIGKVIILVLYISAGWPAFAQVPGKRALLVVDVQENLLKSASRLHMDSAEVPLFLQNLDRTIDAFSEQNIPILYTINEWANPITNLMTGNVCKKGAKGTTIDKRVVVVGNSIYRKSRSNALSNKDLLKFIEVNSISELYITGLFAEACVMATAKAAIKKGYKVTLIEDAIGSTKQKRKIKSIRKCKAIGVSVTTTDHAK